MTVIIKVAVPGTRKAKPTPSVPKKKTGHTKPKPYHGSLDVPGRFRVAHWLHLLGISHSAFYARLKPYHRYPLPKPDGDDGRPYWNTDTVLKYMQK